MLLFTIKFNLFHRTFNTTFKQQISPPIIIPFLQKLPLELMPNSLLAQVILDLSYFHIRSAWRYRISICLWSNEVNSIVYLWISSVGEVCGRLFFDNNYEDKIKPFQKGLRSQQGWTYRIGQLCTSRYITIQVFRIFDSDLHDSIAIRKVKKSLADMDDINKEKHIN